jgi:hypothetical protein
MAVPTEVTNRPQIKAPVDAAATPSGAFGRTAQEVKRYNIQDDDLPGATLMQLAEQYTRRLNPRYATFNPSGSAAVVARSSSVSVHGAKLSRTCYCKNSPPRPLHVAG